ncbi:MAG: hypothetical protein AB7E80_16130 [Hyphomicrobiaceae bacterium]
MSNATVTDGGRPTLSGPDAPPPLAQRSPLAFGKSGRYRVAGWRYVRNAGAYRFAAPKGLATAPRESRTIEEIQTAEVSRRHTRLMVGLFAGLAILVTLGIVGDMMMRTG